MKQLIAQHELEIPDGITVEVKGRRRASQRTSWCATCLPPSLPSQISRCHPRTHCWRYRVSASEKSARPRGVLVHVAGGLRIPCMSCFQAGSVSVLWPKLQPLQWLVPHLPFPPPSHPTPLRRPTRAHRLSSCRFGWSSRLFVTEGGREGLPKLLGSWFVLAAQSC